MQGQIHSTLPQLDASAFDNWMFRLKCILEERGLIEIINQETIDEKTKNLDAKAKSIIVQCLQDRHLNIVKECTTSKQMITVLINTFQRKSVISKITLRRKLVNLKHTSGNLEEYFASYETIIRELEVIGEKIEESDKVCYLLTGLGEEYNHIITALETVNTEIKLEFVKAKLLDHEVRKDKVTEQESSSSFVSSDIICYRCLKKGHKSFECSSQGRGRGRGYCYSRGRGRGRGYRGPRTRGGAAQPAEQQHPLFIASDEALLSDNQNGIINFIVDSGATQHIKL